MTKKMVNILLVEDDTIDAESIRRALNEHKIPNSIYYAKDGVEALEMLRGENGHAPIPSPYLLLIDINMPRMDGIELLSNIRNDKDLKSTIVFVLTTSNSEEDKKRAYEYNVAGYLVKSKAGHDFTKLVYMLDFYWEVVEFPKCGNDA